MVSPRRGEGMRITGKPAMQTDPHLVQPDLLRTLPLTAEDHRRAALTVAEHYAEDPAALRETLAMLGLDQR